MRPFVSRLFIGLIIGLVTVVRPAVASCSDACAVEVEQPCCATMDSACCNVPEPVMPKYQAPTYRCVTEFSYHSGGNASKVEVCSPDPYWYACGLDYDC